MINAGINQKSTDILNSIFSKYEKVNAFVLDNN